MLFSALCAQFFRMESISKRTELVEVLKEIILESGEDIAASLYLSQGKLAPDFLSMETGIAESTIVKVISQITGSSAQDIMKEYSRSGDLGDVAEKFSKKVKQTTFFTEPLGVGEVHSTLTRISKIKGAGTASEKEKILTSMLLRANSLESRYIIRIASGRMRLGASDFTILSALRLALRPELEQSKVEEIYNFHPDVFYLYQVLASGRDDIYSGPVPLIPMKVMLAERLQSMDSIMEKLGGRAALEFKYDGLRIQVHKKGDSLRTFSRGNEENTDQFPEIREYFSSLPFESFIIDGELVPYNSETGEIYSFQQVSRRRGRKYGYLEESIIRGNIVQFGQDDNDNNPFQDEVPLAVFLFDIVYLNGEDLSRKSYSERTGILRESFREENYLKFASRIITDSAEEGEQFLESAISSGCEGIVAKSLSEDSFYRAGARGWTWIKFKRDYRNQLGDSMDLVIIGAFHGHGKRTGTYGALLLASYNSEKDTFESVCKIGTGFTDVMLSDVKAMLSDLVTADTPQRVESKMQPDVWIYPQKILEVRGSEITLSPIHTCSSDQYKGQGLAIRFPRFTGRFRNDKKPEDCTTSSEISEMYAMQKKMYFDGEK